MIKIYESNIQVESKESLINGLRAVKDIISRLDADDLRKILKIFENIIREFGNAQQNEKFDKLVKVVKYEAIDIMAIISVVSQLLPIITKIIENIDEEDIAEIKNMFKKSKVSQLVIN